MVGKTYSPAVLKQRQTYHLTTSDIRFRWVPKAFKCLSQFTPAWAPPFCLYEFCKNVLQGISVNKQWSTFGKLQQLLQETDLIPNQFVSLCNLYGVEISNATLSRAIKAGKFNNHETDEMLRPLILKLEDLVQRAAPFRISFENAEDTKLILDVLDLGVDIQVGASIKINSNSSNDEPAAE